MSKFVIVIAIGLAVVTSSAAELGVPTLIDAAPTNGGQVRVGVQWAADPDVVYDVLTTTSLTAAAWSPVTNAPIAPTNLIGELSTLTTNRTGFYRVEARDTQGPVITARYPATNGVGVGRSATLSISVRDASGIDTNAFSLSVNGGPLQANGSPGVTASTNLFQYTPGTNTWGPFGGTVTVAFVCADLLGYFTISVWSFTLEVQPVVTNDLLHLRPPTGSSLARTRAVLTTAAEQHGVRFSDNLTIVSIASNQVVFGYTGGSHGLYVGAILINHDPESFFLSPHFKSG